MEEKKNINQPRFFWLFFFLITALAILYRFPFIQTLPFDSDQAIVGLMGKHILNGAFPWLYYGDSYSGTLEPLLTSWSFLFFGISRWSLHLIPFIFSILFVVSIYQLGRELYDRKIGLLSMLLATVPNFSMSFYPSLAYGGYIEILWLGNLILLITHRLAVQKETASFIPLFLLGLLWGISWWTYPISVVYLLASFCFLFYFKIQLIGKGKILLTTGFGFILGSAPFWIWNSIQSFPFLNFTQSQENPDFSYRIIRFFHQFLDFFKAGIKEDISFITYAFAVLFVISLLFLLVAPKWHREKFPESKGPALLLVFFLSFCFCYIGSRFSEQNASRYLLPLYSLIPITLALLCFALKTIRKAVYVGMVIVLLTINIYHQVVLNRYLTNDSIRYRKQLQVEQILADFLRKKNLSFVYAPEYWSAAKLTFNNQEDPVFCLPFKGRYPLYALLADAAPKTAFVLEGEYHRSFEEMFKAMGGTYKREIFSLYQKIKGYVLYYDFEPPSAASQEILPVDWKGKSNVNLDSAQWTLDRNISTSWSSSSSQQPGMFYQIDLGRIYKINRIVLLCGKGKEWDFPANYRIELSGNERNWKEIASVKNNWAYLFWSGGRPFWKLRDGRIETNFNPQDSQFIRISITGPAPLDWSIGEIFVYQAANQIKSNPVPTEEIVSFLSKEKIEYVYADIGLSAQMTRLTQGKIKCLQEDYDITHGKDYSMWGYNGSFPYFNKLKKYVDFSLSPAFVVAKENNQSFVRTIQKLNGSYQVKTLGDFFVYYQLKIPERAVSRTRPGSSITYYWNGTHLLKMNPSTGGKNEG